MLDDATLKGRIIGAALRLAAEKPWSEVTLSEIAHAAGAGLVDLRGEFSGKGAILAAFIRAVDDEMLRRAPRRRPEDLARDALFEVIMTRFDVLAPYKAALRSISRDATPEPLLARAVLSAHRWMLAAAGVNTDGAAGAVRLAGLASVYGAVSQIWLDDDDPGHARTMAALDRRLRSGERTLSAIDGMLGGLQKLAGRLDPRRRGSTSRSQSPPMGEEPAAGGGSSGASL